MIKNVVGNVIAVDIDVYIKNHLTLMHDDYVDL